MRFPSLVDAVLLRRADEQVARAHLRPEPADSRRKRGRKPSPLSPGMEQAFREAHARGLSDRELVERFGKPSHWAEYRRRVLGLAANPCKWRANRVRKTEAA